MKLKQLKLYNYCQYVDKEVELEDGLAVLLGKNGSGKSNFLNAIFYSLTGESAIENKTRPKMLKWGEKKGYIQLTFEIDTVEYKVKRNLQSATAKMEWETEESRESLNKATEINIKLAELMQTDANTLLLSSFMPQKGSTKLIFGTTVERMKEYSRLFRLLHLEKSRDLLKKCYNGVETYQDFTEEIAASNRILSEVRLRQESQRANLYQQQGLLGDLRARYTESVKKSAGMSKSTWESAKKAIEECSRDLYDEQTVKTVQLRELGEVVTLTPEEMRMCGIYLDAKTSGAKVLELKSKLDSIIVPEEPICPFTKDKLDTATHNVIRYKTKYQAYQNKECPTCEQSTEVTATELKQMLEDSKTAQSFVTHLRKIEQTYLSDAACYTTIKAEHTKAAEEYTKALEDFTTLSTMVESFDYESYQVKYKKHEYTQATQGRRKELEARLNQITPTLEAKEKELSDLTVAGYFEEGGEDDKFIQHFEELRDKMIPDTQQKLAGLDKEVEMLSSLIAEKEGFVKLWRVCEEFKEHLQNVRDILHVDNFPRKLISAYRPLLQKLVSKYLSIFKQPFCIDINEELAVVCIFSDNPEVGVSDLSGGQQMLLTVAFRLAIAEITPSNVSFISMDEPTNHLDADSKEYLAETFGLVKEYLNTKRIQMIVSTHEPRIQTVADYTIEV